MVSFLASSSCFDSWPPDQVENGLLTRWSFPSCVISWRRLLFSKDHGFTILVLFQRLLYLLLRAFRERRLPVNLLDWFALVILDVHAQLHGDGSQEDEGDLFLLGLDGIEDFIEFAVVEGISSFDPFFFFLR